MGKSDVERIKQDLAALAALEAVGERKDDRVDGSIYYRICNRAIWDRAREASSRMPGHVRTLLEATGKAS